MNRSVRAPLSILLSCAVLAAPLATPAMAARTAARNVSTPAVTTTFGGFLAGRFAATERDNKDAAQFYALALRGIRDNPDLVNRTFIAYLSAGEMEQAISFAKRMLDYDKDNALAQLVIAVGALRSGNNATARRYLDPLGRRPIFELVTPLMSAWSYGAEGNWNKAVSVADDIRSQDAINVLRDFAIGEMFARAGKREDALERLKTAYDRVPLDIRVTDAFARELIRSKRRVEASVVLSNFDSRIPRNPVVKDLMKAIDDGRDVRSSVVSARQGSAEVLAAIAPALAKQGYGEYAVVFLQLALYLDPTNAFTLTNLGELYTDMKKPDLAVSAYQRVPASSPLRRNADIAQANSLDALDRTKEAVGRLDRLIKQNPSDLEAIMTLGGIYQGRKRFAEAAETFTRAVNVIGKPTATDWPVFYYRGIAYERTKQWPKAEADFKRALELSPDQPSVLNYLGYSWIDQGVKLKEGTEMLRRAVAQRPDDGYIIDSLGWAYFRQGDYENAVTQLERAVALKPSDPTLNDHLGDAYWQAGRKLEATFQWRNALDLKPEQPEDAKRIALKLKEGLKIAPPAVADKTTPAKGG